MVRLKLGVGKMIQIKGDVKFPITLDSTTWILMIESKNRRY